MYNSECEMDCMYLRGHIAGAVRVVTNKEGPFGYIVYLRGNEVDESMEYPEEYRGCPIFYCSE